MSKINLQSYGSGETVLFCFPGWVHPIEKEPFFLELLKSEYTVISVHLPGYVDAYDLQKFMDFPSLAQDFLSLLEKYKNKKIVFLGFSMGCRFIMQIEKIKRSKHRKIFIGSPVGHYELPLWSKILIENKFLINVFRKIPLFKQYAVDLALRTITKNKNSKFVANTTSLSGAFDSLLGLIMAKTELKLYSTDSLFIYGDKDDYLNKISEYKINKLKIIPNSPHNCVNGNEKKVMKLIQEELKL